MVTFPAVIGAGSDAKFCVSLLKPSETLQMKIYLVHNNQSRTLLQKTVEKDLHQCFHFEVRITRNVLFVCLFASLLTYLFVCLFS